MFSSSKNYLKNKILILSTLIFSYQALAVDTDKTDYTFTGPVTINSEDTFELRGHSNTANYSITNNGITSFFDKTSATKSVIDNNGSFSLNDDCDADGATITNKSSINFSGTSALAQATLTNNSGANLTFNNNSNAGYKNINGYTIVNDNGANIFFKDSSNAFGAKINNNGNINLSGNTALAQAVLVNNNGANLTFNENSNSGGSSKNSNITNNKGANIYFNDNSNAFTSDITNYSNINFAGTSALAQSTLINNDSANLTFNNSSQAGNSSITNNKGANIYFNDASKGYTANITNYSNITLTGTSDLSQATLINNDSANLTFTEHSNAGGSIITNNTNSNIYFKNNSYGYTSNITNYGAIDLTDNSGLSQATLINNNGGNLIFNDSSDAGSSSGNSNITNNSGANIDFNDSSTANSAKITNKGNLSVFTNSLAIGALVSSGTLNLSDKILAIGSLNSNDNLISGVLNSSDKSSIIKVGSGSLMLELDYPGELKANSGTLNISNALINNLDVANGATANYLDGSNASNGVVTTNGTTKFSGSAIGGKAKLITNAGGLVDISGITGDSITVGSIEGAGSYYLGSKNLIAGGNNLNTTVSGKIYNANGTFTKTGTGTTIFNGMAKSYTTTEIKEGILQVDTTVTSPFFTIDKAGTLTGIGTINGNVTNMGTIAPGNSSNSGVLTINGNYTGSNGTLNIRLMNNDNDVLVINNDANTLVGGTTYVALSGSGGRTSPKGIKIIETAGSATNAFALSQQTINNYPYNLTYDQNDFDWYLTIPSRTTRGLTPIPDPVGNGYKIIPPLINEYGKQSISSISNSRFINDIDPKHKNKFWINILGNVGKIRSNNPSKRVGYKFDIVAMQVGQDVMGYYDQNGGKYIAGVYGALGKINSKVDEDSGGIKLNANIYSVGAYANYLSTDKLYTDFIMQGTKYDINSKEYKNYKISPTAYSFATSAAMGYSINLSNDIKLKPEAQVLYQYNNIENTNNSTSNIHFNNADSFKTKIGIAVTRNVKNNTSAHEDYQKTNVIMPTLFANYWREYIRKNNIVITALNSSDVVISNNKVPSDWIEYGLGANSYISKDVQLYAKVKYQATPNFKSYIVGGVAGIRINF